MKSPKYTDSSRYPNGYKKSTNTDVAATFRRIRAEQAEVQAEVKAKVAPLRKAKA